MRQITNGKGVVLATSVTGAAPGLGWRCAHKRCRVWLQPTITGDITDGVRAHWRACHPERKAC